MWGKLQDLRSQIGNVTHELGQVTQDLLKQTTTESGESTTNMSEVGSLQPESVQTIQQKLSEERTQVIIKPFFLCFIRSRDQII